VACAEGKKKHRSLYSYSPQERRVRLKTDAFALVRRYLETPCAVPNCPCMVHRLGLPQVDVVVEVMGRALRPQFAER